jgi:hypothetical protein
MAILRQLPPVAVVDNIRKEDVSPPISSGRRSSKNMNESELSRLLSDVQELRTAYRVQQWLLAASFVVIALFASVSLRRSQSVMASTTDKDGIMHVRGLVVEDGNQRERVRLGAPLPDPMIHGVRYKRKGSVSGLIISDAEGNERGGYVTSDQFGEAFLTLDSEDEQQVLFLANPKGGVNFDIFDSKGNDANLTVFPAGPKLTMKRKNATVVELPPASR